MDYSTQSPFFPRPAGRELSLKSGFGSFPRSGDLVAFADFRAFFLGRRLKGQAVVAWEEITSRIKGSPDALEKGAALSEDEYVRSRGRACPAAAEVWHAYEEYEAWRRKQEPPRFDLLDVTLHVVRQLRREGYRGLPIRRFYVDEVQDLSLAQLFLLLKLTPQLFCTGDTAQCIVPGVDFLFRDLNAALFAESRRRQLACHRCCSTVAKAWRVRSCRSGHEFLFCSADCAAAVPRGTGMGGVASSAERLRRNSSEGLAARCRLCSV